MIVVMIFKLGIPDQENQVIICVKDTGYTFYPEEEDLDNNSDLVISFIKYLFVEEELIHYALKVLASTHILSNKLQSIIFFMGSGSNGETALGNLLKYVLGEYAASLNLSLFLRELLGPDKPNPHIVELNSAHVSICEEPDTQSVKITGDTKAITRNVEFIKARTLYQDTESVFVDFLFIINTNSKLTVFNLDNALMNRIIAIPFLL